MDISGLFMVNKKENDSFYDETPGYAEIAIQGKNKISSGPWFTLDDVLHSLWRKRLLDFGAWLDT